MNSIEEKIIKNMPLSQWTTFGIGGSADGFIIAETEMELSEAVKYSLVKKIPFFIIGGGSNLLICDEGFRGLVIKNNIKGIEIDNMGEQSKREEKKRVRISVKGGTCLGDLVNFALEEGLTGLEFATGIPGTVGGAVFGNAGAYGKSVGDQLVSARIMTSEGNIKEVERDYFKFGYRWSYLKESREILTEAKLELKPGDRNLIKSEMDRIIKERESKHPHKGVGCAGSYFKNLPPETPGGRRIPAGLLLEQVGAKGICCRGAKVFEGHANFILNGEKATCKDILALAEEMKRRVKEKFGVELEEEVMYVDERGQTC